MFEQPKTLEGHDPVIINLLLIKSCYQSQNAFLYELFKVEIDENSGKRLNEPDAPCLVTMTTGNHGNEATKPTCFRGLCAIGFW